MQHLDKKIDQRPAKLVKVIHGANADTFDCVGAKVDDIRANLVDAFNLSPRVIAFVDGHLVSGNRQLGEAETVEFIVPSGRKGLGRLLTPDDLMNAWGIDRVQYESWIAEGLPTEQLADGSTAHFELAIDEWCRARTKARIGKHPPAPKSKWLRLKEAAALLGASTRMLAQFANRGEIAHKRRGGRGRGGRGEYLFLPEEIERFNARTTVPAKNRRVEQRATLKRPRRIATKIYLDPSSCGRGTS